MLRCKKIPWNFPWNHSPKRGWFHSIYIIEWKVPGLWFHGNSMERGSRCPTLSQRVCDEAEELGRHRNTVSYLFLYFIFS
jgi:hypothetical protein